MTQDPPTLPADHPVAAALQAAALGLGPPPAGARRLVRLDLPPRADLTAAAPWIVLNPANGCLVAAPVECCGEGLRLWHERAKAIGLEPGFPVWVAPC
jgi:hypothetical protein